MNSSINWICPECGYSTPKVWPNCKRCLAPNPEAEASAWNTIPVEIIPGTDLDLYLNASDEGKWKDLNQ